MGYKDALNYIKSRLENNITSYPISIKEFNDYLGGISEEEMYLLFGTTGSSKTKIAIRLFVIDLVDYVFKNPEKDIQIYYFTLELSTIEIYLNIFCHLLHLKTGEYYDIKYFKNKSGKKQLDLSVFEEFELVRDWLEILDKKVKIIDYCRTPTEIFSGLEKKLTTVHGKIVENEQKLKHYEKNNPSQLILIIVDTINAFRIEKGMDKYSTIDLWCANYCKQELKMFYKCAIINVQQMDFVFMIYTLIFVQQLINVEYVKENKFTFY